MSRQRAFLDVPDALDVALPPRPAAGDRWGLALTGLALVGLAVASFVSLDLHWAEFLGRDALVAMGRFVASFVPPAHDAPFLLKVAQALGETFAMSIVGTALAAAIGALLALPASSARWRWRAPARGLLNALRAVPELVWAALLLVSAGLGPFPGTLALALHTTGVLGRLFADSLENVPREPAQALRLRGVSGAVAFLYATGPQLAPQWLSYGLYRWENNIRAAAVLGVVGAGGLGQMLSVHLGLFQMAASATVLIAMIVLVALVDALSAACRQALSG